MSQLLENDRKYVWHPFTQMQNAAPPLAVVQAKDALLFTEDGQSYIDANSSWWVNTHGHGNEYIAEAIKNQLDELDHAIFAGATHPKAVELATRLVQLLPEKLEKVFFSDDGSTAVEVALKMVIQYWYNLGTPKTKILALDGAYHGDTFGAMSVGQRGYFNQPFEALFFEVSFLDFPFHHQEENCLNQAKQALESGEIAGLIVEPIVQGSAGMRMYRPAFLDDLMVLAQSYNVPVIFDEVMTGWGRTGRLFAMNYVQEVPDIVCLSKGVTGGVLPLGLTVASIKIYNAFLDESKSKALLHGHSFTGNALACAAACANLDLIEDVQFFDEIERISRAHTQFYNKLRNNPLVSNIRQAGTILAIELKDEQSGGYFSGLRDKLYPFFLERNILLRPLGNVLFLNPPYCITDEQLEELYAAIEELLISLGDN